MQRITDSNERRFVRPEEVEALIDTVRNGEFYSVIFERAAAKCPVCGKSNKKWNGLDYCPICGAALSKERETLAQNGVHNPQNAEYIPNGNGESARQAREDGRIKYYDPQVENANGTRGAYRQFYAVNVRRLKIRGVEYIVVR